MAVATHSRARRRPHPPAQLQRARHWTHDRPLSRVCTVGAHARRSAMIQFLRGPARWLANALVLVAGLGAGQPASAQDRRDEQFYYPGSFNWQFLKRYPDAARLFNAFDYGHAVLYEILYTRRGDDAQRRLADEFQYLTTDLLVHPPRFAIAEEAVMPSYAKLAWRAKEMFDWAHMLHRQIYDAYAEPRLTPAARD